MTTHKIMARASKEADPVGAECLLHEHGIHLINGEIDYDSTDRVITWLLESSLRKSKKIQHLTLIVNSHGGDLHCSFAIIDMMRASALPVHTVGLGQISSSGLMTFLAGDPGHRVLTPNTSIMSHQWTGETSGKAHELVSAQRYFDITTERVMAHYRHCTHLTDETITQKLLPPHDVFLTADEALALNLCDDIRLMG